MPWNKRLLGETCCTAQIVLGIDHALHRSCLERAMLPRHPIIISARIIWYNVWKKFVVICLLHGLTIHNTRFYMASHPVEVIHHLLSLGNFSCTTLPGDQPHGDMRLIVHDKIFDWCCQQRLGWEIVVLAHQCCSSEGTIRWLQLLTRLLICACLWRWWANCIEWPVCCYFLC